MKQKYWAIAYQTINSGNGSDNRMTVIGFEICDDIKILSANPLYELIVHKVIPLGTPHVEKIKQVKFICQKSLDDLTNEYTSKTEGKRFSIRNSAFAVRIPRFASYDELETLEKRISKIGKIIYS